MRVIGKFDQESLAYRFSIYLRKLGVENVYEHQQENFVVWVYNEDEVAAANICLEEFNKDPMNFRFDVFISQMEDKGKEENFEKQVLEEMNFKIPKKKFQGKITVVFIIFCFLIYLFNSIEQKKLDKTLPYSDFYMTKVQYYLFFDAPYTNEQISAIFQKYDVTTETKLPKAMIRDLNKVMTPAWPGIYNLALAGMLHKTVPVKGIFESIKKWQVWRLFSPTVLHRDFLHILFNMIWLWVLGRQIEERMSLFRYLFLILLLALFTNVAQYLISGPYFMGFSGVITGMAGFIWMRQRIANWEGYTITKGTYYFLLFFVLSMCFLQILSFVLSLLAVKFPVSIANTAHVVGLFLGLLLGKWPFFAWRIVEH